MCPPAPSGHVQPLEVTGVGFQPLIDDRLNRSWQESQPGVCALEKGLAGSSLQAELSLLLLLFQKCFFLLVCFTWTSHRFSSFMRKPNVKKSSKECAFYTHNLSF